MVKCRLSNVRPMPRAGRFVLAGRGDMEVGEGGRRAEWRWVLGG